MNRKQIVLSIVVMLLITAVVWAATEVTVTKSSSKYVTGYDYVDGGYYRGAYIQETDDGYLLTYYVYDYSIPGYLEQGQGYIDDSDVTWTSNSVTLDTNTADIAIIGDGGDIYLTWELAPDGATVQSYKQTVKTDLYKQIVFSDTESASTVVAGSFLGEAFSGTGAMQSTKGKVILQYK